MTRGGASICSICSRAAEPIRASIKRLWAYSSPCSAHDLMRGALAAGNGAYAAGAVGHPRVHPRPEARPRRNGPRSIGQKQRAPKDAEKPFGTDQKAMRELVANESTNLCAQNPARQTTGDCAGSPAYRRSQRLRLGRTGAGATFAGGVEVAGLLI